MAACRRRAYISGWRGTSRPVHGIAEPVAAVLMTTISPDRRTRQKGLAPHWSFLTNHTYVLLAIARDRDVRLREIASQVGITERAVQKIIGELEASGILTKSRDGRRNHYEVDASVSLRHPLEGDRSIAALLGVLLDDRRDPAGLAPRA